MIVTSTVTRLYWNKQIPTWSNKKRLCLLASLFSVYLVVADTKARSNTFLIHWQCTATLRVVWKRRKTRATWGVTCPEPWIWEVGLLWVGTRAGSYTPTPKFLIVRNDLVSDWNELLGVSCSIDCRTILFLASNRKQCIWKHRDTCRTNFDFQTVRRLRAWILELK